MKLINLGNGGLEVEAVSPLIKENPVTKEKIQVLTHTKGYKYPIPISNSIQDLFKRMRRYLLEINGYWKDSYDQYVEKGEVIDKGSNMTAEYYEVLNYMQKTVVTGVELTLDGRIRLEGVLINSFGVSVNLKTPAIKFADSYDGFSRLTTGCKRIMEATDAFISNKMMEKINSRQYLLALFSSDKDKQEEINEMGEDELDSAMITELEKRRFVVIVHPSEMSEEKEPVQDIGVDLTAKEEKAEETPVIEPEQMEDLPSDTDEPSL